MNFKIAELCHAVLYRAVPYFIVPFRIVPYCIVPCRIVPCELTKKLALEGDDVIKFVHSHAHPHACIHTHAGMSEEYENAYTQAKALSMHQEFLTS